MCAGPFLGFVHQCATPAPAAIAVHSHPNPSSSARVHNARFGVTSCQSPDNCCCLHSCVLEPDQLRDEIRSSDSVQSPNRGCIYSKHLLCFFQFVEIEHIAIELLPQVHLQTKPRLFKTSRAINTLTQDAHLQASPEIVRFDN